jgi:hypothetical protein
MPKRKKAPAAVTHIVELGRGSWTVQQMLEAAVRDIQSGATVKPAKAVLVIYEHTEDDRYRPCTYRCNLSAFDEIAVLQLALTNAVELARS